MKTITVVIPTYNEEDNVLPLYEAVTEQFSLHLPGYNYEILFIDNASTDETRPRLRDICHKDKKVKAIFNTRNFGPFNSPYYGLCQAKGDAAILLCADFQDPPEMIPQFVEKWESGYKIVSGIKSTSTENKLMYALRSVYYKTIRKMATIEFIEHFTGFGLYDRKVLDDFKELDDPSPFLRGIVAELGYRRCDIPYRQQNRRFGKSSYNWYKLYDAGMLSVTSYTKVGLRMATLGGFLLGFVSAVVALVYLILKLIYWDRFVAGTTPILLGVFFFGSLQLFFLGLLGEYVLGLNTRSLHRPLVVEEERLNDTVDETKTD